MLGARGVDNEGDRGGRYRYFEETQVLYKFTVSVTSAKVAVEVGQLPPNASRVTLTVRWQIMSRGTQHVLIGGRYNQLLCLLRYLTFTVP